MPSDPCTGSDFNVWSYSLDAGGAFAPRIVSSGFWPAIGNESEVKADGEHLFVWTRASGRLRTYALNPGLADPLGEPPLADPPPNKRLTNQEWTPPTTAPAIKHLLLVLQDGRSFDSHFGRYCQGAMTGTAGEPSACSSGASCCESMPPSVPGAAACTDPATDSAYRPDDSPECLRAKIDKGAMDAFAVPILPDLAATRETSPVLPPILEGAPFTGIWPEVGLWEIGFFRHTRSSTPPMAPHHRRRLAH